MSFRLQVWDRGEYASRDHVAFDLGEPQLDLVEPGRVGRSEVQLDVRMLCKERLQPAWSCARTGCRRSHGSPFPRLVGDDVGEERDELQPRYGDRSSCPALRPVLVLKAAYSDSVPCRKYSKPWRSARPGDSGKHRSLRSNAWIAVFSSTQNTAACCGGFRYSPMISAALLSKSGSVGSHVTLQPVRLQSVLRPHPRHHHVRHTELLRQPPAAPVRGAVSGFLARCIENPSLQLRRQPGRHDSSRAQQRTVSMTPSGLQRVFVDRRQPPAGRGLCGPVLR